MSVVMIPLTSAKGEPLSFWIVFWGCSSAFSVRSWRAPTGEATLDLMLVGCTSNSTLKRLES